MRILHTSDWHLGKKIEMKSRLEEQSLALKGLLKTVKENSVDVTLICGDVFDTFVPPADAEELFYETLSQLSALCKVVVISGNHDDSSRLCASLPLAIKHNIFLVGEMDNSAIKTKDVQGGNGYLRIKIKDETLNLGLLPYPSPSKFSVSDKEVGYGEKIAQLIAQSCQCFDDKGVNIFASHLFMEGGEVSGGEKELGTALLINKQALPNNAHYCALGHIHKPQTISKSKRAYYSGSLLPYTFDDKTKKRFAIYDSISDEVFYVDVEGAKQMYKFDFATAEEGNRLLKENIHSFVHLNYVSDLPLKSTDVAMLKSYPSFVKLTVQTMHKKSELKSRAEKSDAELFEAFYESKKGNKPNKRITELFLEILGGEK